MCKLPTKHSVNNAVVAAPAATTEESLPSSETLPTLNSSDFRNSSIPVTCESSHLVSAIPTVQSSSSSTGIKSDEEKQSTEEKDDDLLEEMQDDHGKDDEDLELENLVAQDWQGKQPAAPLQRRQKRRQRQRANTKVGRALRRFVVSKGHRLSTYHQLLLDQSQREIVNYVDFIFGPMNLPNDQYLNNVVLDRSYKSATVVTIVSFEGIQRALATLGRINADLQLAIVVDSLRWSQAVRCGPVCYPDGSIVFCFRVRGMQQPLPLHPIISDLYQPKLLAPTVAYGYHLCICGNCNGMIDPRYGYCSLCGVVFE